MWLTFLKPIITAMLEWQNLTAAGNVTDGNSGNNYTYTFVTNTSGVINARALTITAQPNTKLMILQQALSLQIQILLQGLCKADVANFSQNLQ